MGGLFNTVIRSYGSSVDIKHFGGYTKIIGRCQILVRRSFVFAIIKLLVGYT